MSSDWESSGILAEMSAGASASAEPGGANVETVSFDFCLEHIEKLNVDSGYFVYSHLVPAGSGFVCLKVLVGIDISALVEYVPNVLWSDEWSLPDLKCNIQVVNIDAAKNRSKTKINTFTAKRADWGCMISSQPILWKKCREMGWLNQEGAMTFKVSVKGNFSIEQSLAEDLSATAKMWLTGKLADMVVLADNGDEFRCHRCVMLNASPVFEQMLTNNWQEGKDGQITIRNEAAVVVQVFVGYLYTNLLPQHADYAALLRLADMYEISGLSKVCFSMMVAAVNVDTVGTILRTVVRHKRCPGAEPARNEIVKKARTDEDLSVAVARNFVNENVGSAVQTKLIQHLLSNKQAVVKAMKSVLDDDLLAD